MKISEIIEHDLLRDGSLFQVYKRSFFLAENGFDTILKILFGLFLIMTDYLLAYSKNVLFLGASQAIESWLNLAFLYATTILGFLVRGAKVWAAPLVRRIEHAF